MNLLKSIFLLFFTTCLFQLAAQPDVSELKGVDTIYKDYIRTIEFYSGGDELSLPIIDKNSGVLHVGFDDHYGEYIDYYYTITHCDRNWKQTENVEMADYMNGLSEIQVESFGSSIGTIADYTHYDFDFPNDDLSFNWTGNYLLIVYDSDQTVVFTKKFYVVEEVVSIQNLQFSRPNGVGEFSSHQAFEFQLGIGRLNPLNPLEELHVTGFQNRFNERSLDFKQPFRVRDDRAFFQIGNQFSFPGYKEYREFDTREIVSGQGREIFTIERTETELNVLLELDKNRNPKSNFTINDANGGFLIRNNDRRFGDEDITSQYLNVIFTLRTPIEEESRVYVLGDFNDYKAYPAYQMTFLPNEGIYTVEVPLKQGYYNYMYGTVYDNEVPDLFRFEGSTYEAENRYHFMVYYRPLSGEYDQLVGYLNHSHQPR